MTEEKKKEPESNGLSRREFLRDAGLLVGGAAVGSTILLAACSDNETTTKTVTTTVQGGASTKTVTSTVPGGTATVTKTVTVTDGSGPVADSNVIKFTLDGLETEVQVDPGWDLKHLLHDRLGIIGVKDMCGGYGACGSCSVIMDGKPVLSCMVLAIECDGKTIETSQGIAAAMHPLVDSFIMHDCMQCGYCTP